nr:hypothetical protein [Tanacetum cinerariifolium]
GYGLPRQQPPYKGVFVSWLRAAEAAASV